MKWSRLAALLSVAPLVACIPIPPHHSPISRGNVPEEIPGWLEPGRTTLADTFFRLGEPDDYAADRRTLGWVNINRLVGGVLIFAAGVALPLLQLLARACDIWLRSSMTMGS
jgi:hypothetical protein